MRTPFQFTVYYLWKATIARRTAAIMYTNIWQRFCISYQTKTGDTRQSPSLCWGASWDSLEEIPHAHADLVQSFLHAVVVPILFLFFVIFLKLLWERVVPPSGFLVFFFSDVVAVVNVQLVFFFKLCDAVLDCGFNFCNGLFHVFCPPFLVWFSSLSLCV